MTAPPRGQRRRVAKRVLAAVGLLAAGYLVVRGVAEPFLIDVGDPETYRSDWGGPSLVGVLAVHSGPAVVIVAAAAVWFVRRRQAARPSAAPHGRDR